MRQITGYYQVKLRVALLLLACGCAAQAPARNQDTTEPAQEIITNSDAREPRLSSAALRALGARADLLAVLDRSAMLDALTLAVGDSDVSERDLATHALGRRLELLFAERYPEIREDSGPSIFAVGRIALPDGHRGYLLRVPGMYSSTRTDLWVFDPVARRFAEPVELGENWGDAGEEFTFRSWFVDLNRDGALDIVSHQCSTYDALESDSKPELQAELLSTRTWGKGGFGPTIPVKDTTQLRRFRSGVNACLSSR